MTFKYSVLLEGGENSRKIIACDGLIDFTNQVAMVFNIPKNVVKGKNYSITIEYTLKFFERKYLQKVENSFELDLKQRKFFFLGKLCSEKF